MRSIQNTILLLATVIRPVYSQPGTIQMTPLSDMDLKPQTLRVPDKFRGKIDTNLTVYLPDGYRANVFHVGGLSKPRFLAWGPDSVLHVANKTSGQIIALPDSDLDGVADTARIVASGLHIPHDLEFYQGTLLVAEEQRIIRLSDTDRDGSYETSQIFIDNIASEARVPTGGHNTRTIVVDSAKQKIYLSIGSSCNVCREDHRAIIERYNDDGTGKEIFASGVRNAVGMTLHPRTGALWATNNGSDWQGNDIPPEWIDIVRQGGFYGHSFAHSNQVYFDFNAHQDYAALLPLTGADSALVEKMVQPAALVQAHSAPMAIEFTNRSFGPHFKNGAFVAYRGSWNRHPATGYKVVFLDFDDDSDTTANFVADFLTGFLTDSVRVEWWARPVGLAVDQRGNLYVGSDAGREFILIVSPIEKAFGLPDGNAGLKVPSGFSLHQNYPNPFNPVTTIHYDLPVTGLVEINIYDSLGKKVKTLLNNNQKAGSNSISWDATDDFNYSVGSGIYLYQIRWGEYHQARKMVLLK